jgi:hypothetical protein
MANRRFIDFPIAASVGNDDIVLIWQDGLNKQTTKATLFAGSPNSLAGLTDVDISALGNGQILQYNSTTSKWENVDRTDIDLDQLGDVTIVSPTNGQVLVYNSSTSKWENSSAGFVPYTGAVTTVNLGAQSILAGSFVKAGGTSAQFLKADGSVDSTAYGTGSVTSVALTMPSAFSVANSPITTAGTLAVTGAGTVGQYVRGDGSLADFPATTGGGSSVSYYLNGSVSQGTIGGVAYREFNRNPVFGAGTDISISSDGYIANFITDAGDPNKLLIPAGNWNLETYFSASSNGGTPSFYVELYKYDGSTFTLIASSATSPELIAFGTNLNPYFSTLAVPQTTLALTDRLALRYYVNTSGRTITLHTENDHLCQVITTFTTGLTALNGLTAQVQFFAVGTSGTDFNIASATDTHTFNLPTASGTNRGALSSTDWTTFNNKENAITAGTTAQYFRGDKTFQTLNTSVVPEGTNLYYTDARVNANTNVAANTAARHNAVTLGTANGLSLSTQVLSLGLASAGVTGALSGTDWSTFNSKQNALTLTTTGTSGVATLVGATLNIPNYGNALADYLPLIGGTMTGNINWAQTDRGLTWGFNTDGASIKFYNTGDGDTNSRLEFATIDNNDEYFRWVHIPSGGSAYESMRLVPVSSGNAELIVTGKIIKSGGTSSQFLKADGSVDSTTYVSNVTASSPLASSGGTTPNITIQQASGSQSGFLSSTDWTTFNSKQNALTNPVTGTGTTNYLPKFTGSTTIGNSIVSESSGIITVAGRFNANGNDYHTLSVDEGSAQLRLERKITSTGLMYLGADNVGFKIFDSGFTPRLILTSGGNLLVGTTSDAGFKLDVNGTGRFSGALTVTSNVTIRPTSGYNAFFQTSGTALRINYLNDALSANISATYRATDFGWQDSGGNSILTLASTGAATFAGSLATPHTTKSANYTLNGTDFTVGFDCASNRTATLPDATTCAGRIYVIYQYNTGGGVRSVTLDGNGSQTIDGVTTYSLAFFEDFSSVMIQSNGSNWIVIADKLYPPVT